MEYRQLGSAGVRVSAIGIGTNRFGSEALPQAAVNNIIDAATDLGINYIDTANSYTKGKSEETLGKALKGRWDKFVVASKVWFPVGEGTNDRGTSRYHLMNAIENSLRRLQSDHIDLYYIHRWDEHTPIEETLRALDDLLRMGKIRYVGVSDFTSWQLAHTKLLSDLSGWAPIAVIQSEYHMMERRVEQEVLPYCRAHNVGFVPYFPLAGGFFTGKYQRGAAPPAGSRGETSGYVQKYMTDDGYDKLEKLTAWANARDRGINELAQAWLMAQPSVCSVISGATKLEHILSNAKAADWTLTTEEVEEVNAILDQ
jgi:aryl-alcohol dehydrogenase-like predicted oxidoreductase